MDEQRDYSELISSEKVKEIVVQVTYFMQKFHVLEQALRKNGSLK